MKKTVTKLLDVHSAFENFVLNNKLNFSLVRNPSVQELNNYAVTETAQIFDVFYSGFYAACKQLTAKG